MFCRQLDFVCGAQKRDLGRDADLESASFKRAIKSWAPAEHKTLRLSSSSGKAPPKVTEKGKGQSAALGRRGRLFQD